MKWPLVLRSTFDNLAACLGILREHIVQVESRASQWHKELVACEKRLRELTDLDRTTPEAMAQVFASWDGQRQGQFFNVAGQLTRAWENSRCLQFAYIEPELDAEGRDFIKELSGYTREPT